MQFLTQCFHDQPDQSIRGGIQNKNPVDTNGEMRASYPYGARYTGESVHNRVYRVVLACHCELNSPATRNEKAHTRPDSNSVLHVDAPVL